MKRILHFEFDHFIYGASFLGFIVSFFLLVEDDAIVKNKKANVSSAEQVGKITFSLKDTRLKKSDDIVWNKANQDENIFLGDGVFTGAGSKVEVSLNSGGKISVDEKSLLVFTRKENVDVSKLVNGSFQLNIQGKMKVEIGGQLYQLEGNKTQLSVSIKEKGRPKIKMIKGQIEISKVSKDGRVAAVPVKLEFKPPIAEVTNTKEDFSFEPPTDALVIDNNEISLDEIMPAVSVEVAKTIESISAAKSPVVVETPKIALPVTDVARVMNSNNFTYTPKLYDIYENKNGVLSKRTRPNQFVSMPTHVFWTNSNGENQNKKVVGQLSLSPTFDSVMESFSEDSNLGTQSFKRVYIGKNFYRLSYDNLNWAKTEEFDIRSELLPNVLELTKILPNELFLDGQTTEIKIGFKRKGQISHVITELSTDESFSNSNTIYVWSSFNDTKLSFSQEQRLFIRFTGLDPANRLAYPSPSYQLNVLRPKKIEPVLAKNKGITTEEYNETKRRATSSVEPEKAGSSQAQIRPPDLTYLNREYSSSKFSFEGSGFTMYSQEQISNGFANPVVLTAGLRILDWNNQNGYEAFFKTKMASASSEPSQSVSPMIVEMRYLRRFNCGWSPFSTLSESKLSFILGYEYYRNSGVALFTPKYDLLKIGTGFNFPLWKNSATGGEVLFGIGADGSKKYEVTGFYDYFFKEKWSLGLGYRVHLFEAGSLPSSPGTLPYREGFSEGFSTLKWSY